MGQTKQIAARDNQPETVPILMKRLGECRLLARNGPPAMSDLSPLSGVKLKSDFGAVRTAFDPERTWRLGSKREFHLASRLQFLWKQTMIDELMQRSWDLLFPRQTAKELGPPFPAPNVPPRRSKIPARLAFRLQYLVARTWSRSRP